MIQFCLLIAIGYFVIFFLSNEYSSWDIIAMIIQSMCCFHPVTMDGMLHLRRTVDDLLRDGIISRKEYFDHVKNLVKNYVEEVDREINRLPKECEIDIGVDDVKVVHRRKKMLPKKFADYVLY